MDQIKEELIQAPSNASNEQIKQKIGRGPFLKWLGKVALGIGAAGTLANLPKTTEAASPKTPGTQPLSEERDISPAEPSKSPAPLPTHTVITNSPVSTEAASQKSHAPIAQATTVELNPHQSQIDYSIEVPDNIRPQAEKVKEFLKGIFNRLGMDRLKFKVLIVDASDDKLKGESNNGTYVQAAASQGVVAQVYAREEGKSEMQVAAQADYNKELLEEKIYHESSHLIDPHLWVFKYLLTPEQVAQLDAIYKSFHDAYFARYLSEGKATSWYDRTILDGSLTEAMDAHWSYFLGQTQMGDFDNMGIPRERIAEVLPTIQNPAYKKALEEYLKQEDSLYFGKVDLGRHLARNYWKAGKKGREFLAPLGSAVGRLKTEFDRIAENAITETWGDLGTWAVKYPQAAKDVFPEFFEAFSLSFEISTGKKLSETAIRLRSRKTEEDIAAYYQSCDPETRKIIKWATTQAYQIHTKGNDQENSEDLRQAFINEIKNKGWLNQQMAAIAFELFMENPEELKSTLNAFN